MLPNKYISIEDYLKNCSSPNTDSILDLNHFTVSRYCNVVINAKKGDVLLPSIIDEHSLVFWS